MEQRLRQILLDGEQIRWTGRPIPFRLMQCPERGRFFTTWLLSGGVLLLAVLQLRAVCSNLQRGGLNLLIFLAVVTFLPVMFSVRPLLDKFCLEKSTIYAITNLRVIALVKDNLMFLPLNCKLEVAVEGQDQDCGNLCFGAAVGEDGKKSRSNAVLGIRGNGIENDILGMLFYHVRHPEQLLCYLS